MVKRGDPNFAVLHNILTNTLLFSRLISPRPAREDELNLFHSTDYLECLKRLSDEDDDEKHGEDAETYGLSKREYYNVAIVDQRFPRVLALSIRSKKTIVTLDQPRFCLIYLQSQ